MAQGVSEIIWGALVQTPKSDHLPKPMYRPVYIQLQLLLPGPDSHILQIHKTVCGYSKVVSL